MTQREGREDLDDLLQRVRDSDVEAYSELVAALTPVVKRYIGAQRFSREDREDIVQDLLIKVMTLRRAKDFSLRREDSSIYDFRSYASEMFETAEDQALRLSAVSPVAQALLKAEFPEVSPAKFDFARRAIAIGANRATEVGVDWEMLFRIGEAVSLRLGEPTGGQPSPQRQR